jgi:hypothetical protein
MIVVVILRRVHFVATWRWILVLRMIAEKRNFLILVSIVERAHFLWRCIRKLIIVCLLWYIMRYLRRLILVLIP